MGEYLGITFISNQVFNIIFGWMGDKIGFRRTIQIFGSILTGVATLIVYWVPMIWGITMSPLCWRCVCGEPGWLALCQ